MSPHVFHPSIAEAGLCASCPRCVEMAKDPATHLDDDNLLDLYLRALRVQKGEDTFRTEPEADAAERVLDAVRLNTRLANALDRRGLDVQARIAEWITGDA